MSIVGKSSQYTSGFDPKSLGDCALWLDAADSNTFTLSGSNVTTWRDKSSNGAVTSNPDTASTYTTDLGRPAVFMPTVRMAISNFTLNREHSTFLVTRCTTTTNNFIITNWLSTYLMYFYYGNDGLFYNQVQTYFDPGVAVGSTIQSDNTQRGMVTYVHNRSSLRMRKNGTLTTINGSGPAAGTDTGTFYINGNGNGSFATVYVSEVIIFNTALTNAQHQTVEGYLARKWGITSRLPNSHIFKSLPPFSRPFVPVDIPGCALWLDAADSTALTLSGSNVTAWNDKSGFGNNCSNQSAGTTITYPGTKVNGLNTVNFAAGCIRGAFNGTSVINTPNVSIFIVTTHTAPNNNLRLFSLTPSASYQDDQASQMLVYCSSNYQVTFFRSGVMPTAYTVTQNVPFLYTVTQTSGTGSMWLNGGSNSNATITTSAFAVTNYNIGTQYLANQNYTGLVSEVIVYNTLLTASQRQTVETYLANKWGLRGSTPAGHLARLAPALTPVFNPLMIDGCQLWLDAADVNGNGTIPSAGSAVSTWVDKSGLGNNGTAGGTAPTYTASTRGVTFSSGYYTTNYSASLQSETVFLVFITSAMTLNHRLIASTTGGRELFLNPSGSLFAKSVGVGDMVNTGSGTISNNTVILMTYQLTSAANPIIYTYGNQRGTGVYTTLSAGRTTSVGYTPGGTEYFVGTMFEILGYNASLSTSQRQAVEGYLAAKWGVANSMPNTHPFKRTRP